MKILYYDIFCGISGDMHLGALLDLGVPIDYIKETLALLPLSGEYRLEIAKGEKMGITGTKASVWLQSGHYDLPEEHKVHDHPHDHAHDHDHPHDHAHDHAHDHPHDHAHDHAHDHPHDHAHDHHHHHHTDPHSHTHNHNHAHRAYKDIVALIQESQLQQEIKAKSLAVFYEIAKAEATVHGKSIDEVHFHEVGSVDAIVDIVSAAAALVYLKVDRVLSSSVHVGGGMVRCAHGNFPVPAPATTEILKGVPLVFGRVQQETTTPTGAAILKAFVDEFTPAPRLSIEKIGYGLGTKNFEIPNVLRVFLGSDSAVDRQQGHWDKEWVLETNLDDMSPEHLPSLEKLLMAAGAKDVWKTAITMKKQRLGITLSVLCPELVLDSVGKLILQHSTAAGFRQYPVDKFFCNWVWETVETPYGPVRLKKYFADGELIKVKPEFEDCLALANLNGVSTMEVSDAARLASQV